MVGRPVKKRDCRECHSSVTSLIEVQGLTKRFGRLTAVRDVTFTVARGEVLGFLGPNGAGKSTTMKMLAGYLDPTAGQVILAGEDVARTPLAARQKLGYLPEGAPLYGEMSPAGLLRFAARIRGLEGTAWRLRRDWLVQRLALGEVWHRPIDSLSKGFKRRVALAQAILHDPPVLLLDEPTDGLDPNQKHEVRLLLNEMAAEKAILVSTHILDEVEAVCSRALIIAQGRILADDTPAALFAGESPDAAFRRLTRTPADA